MGENMKKGKSYSMLRTNRFIVCLDYIQTSFVLLQREYWIGRKGATAELSSDDFITLVSESRAPFFETPLQDDRAGIRIRGLTKVGPLITQIHV